MSEEADTDYSWSGAHAGRSYSRPLSKDAVQLMPISEQSVSARRIDDGSWLVTETTVTRKVQAERPRFEVVNPGQAT